MNRSQRRAFARGKGAAASAPADIAALMDEAVLAYRQGQRGQAAAICKQILHARAGARRRAQSLGHLASGVGQSPSRRQSTGKGARGQTISMRPATTISPLRIRRWATRPSAAATHFKKAIALGLSGKDVEQFLQQNEIIGKYVRQILEDNPTYRSSAKSDSLPTILRPSPATYSCDARCKRTSFAACRWSFS